jgi:hypothetical protein
VFISSLFPFKSKFDKIQKSLPAVALLGACAMASPSLALTPAAVAAAEARPMQGSPPLNVSYPSMYARWTNGPWQNPAFFPISVFWQSPNQTGTFGAYTSQAGAAAGEHINIFQGITGESTSGLWPEFFGRDLGELEAVKAHNLYLIGGIKTPFLQNTSTDSVASVLTLARAIGAQANVIGYQTADEPGCAAGDPVANGYTRPVSMTAVPTIIGGVQQYDPTRVVLLNETAWMISPQFQSCLTDSISALQSTDIGSMDSYTATRAYVVFASDFAKSDFYTVPNDTLFFQGLETQALIHFGRQNQPIWTFVEAGGDNYGAAEAANVLQASITSGSNVLVNVSGRSVFSPTWVGLTVSGTGIPAGAKITRFVDRTHAVMSVTATASAAREGVRVTGGVQNSDCVASVNLCVVNGNEYRATPVQVNAEVWMSLISGANGIEYFCHDLTTSAFCLGAARGGTAAAVVQSNLTYVNSTVLSYAPVLNSPTLGICSMQHEDYATGARSTTTSCNNGILTLTTTNAAIPGLAMVKQYNGSTYLFVQSDRRSATGAIFKMAVTGTSGKHARVVYDSNDHYDHVHTSVGSSFPIGSSATFSDTLGANHDDYQVKIYQIQ